MDALLRSLLVAVLASVLAMDAVLALAQGCPECDENACRPPTDCLAGRVRDRCGCCYVCGRREGELCDGEELPLPYRTMDHEPCGENLRCRPRTDLAPGDPPAAHCVCERTDVLCGSDGNTYENECQLTEARYRARNGLKAVHRGPCKSAPRIVSPPEDVSNMTGGSVAMSCEAMGWPIPTIEWRVDKAGDIVPLPSDDSKIAVQSRGGPGKYELTGWLQMLSISPLDDATYWCVARNEEGEASAAARIVVLDAEGQRGEIRSNDL